ncbi:hypothetical protein GCM10017596_09410 [Microbacterium keratanolyticum]|uniref:Uncharacterized protein n=1 Tax=Microbacterium keratanolyticum TaxID=67574 RepID=A0A9W6HQX3_9MICO|nr:hypothetical protein GCM10017596_09410 [Microbacterium keratanolyticum]
MLEDQDWVRLIAGLVSATRDGRLEWQGDDSSARSVYASMASGIASALGTARTRLRATTARSAYEVSASPGGLAPHALSVWEVDGSTHKKIGTVESSVRSLEMREGINEALRALWSVAAATIEPGNVVVDRLLGELEE